MTLDEKPPKKAPIVKSFNRWTKLKRKLNDNKGLPAGYKERDIWWVSVGYNVGFEEDGKGENFNRPVLIIKGFSKYTFWGLPLSTTKKEGIFYHPFIVNGKVSTALLSQLRIFDTRRFINKYGVVSKKDFENIKAKLVDFLS